MSMVKTTFSDHYEAIRSRMRRLPKLLTEKVENLSYSDAVRLIELFKEGIRTADLRLRALQPETIKRKERANYVSPENPLYGTFRFKNRFNNMMEVVRDKTRWIVRPRNGLYHPRQKKDGTQVDSKLTMRQMFDVHEYGATINGKSRSGRPTNIRIPPRPAFRYAYNKLLREKIGNDDAEQLKARCVQYIKTGYWKSAKRRKLKAES